MFLSFHQWSLYFCTEWKSENQNAKDPGNSTYYLRFLLLVFTCSNKHFPSSAYFPLHGILFRWEGNWTVALISLSPLLSSCREEAWRAAGCSPHCILDLEEEDGSRLAGVGHLLCTGSLWCHRAQGFMVSEWRCRALANNKELKSRPDHKDSL